VEAYDLDPAAQSQCNYRGRESSGSRIREC
jgi:hypothetical protein